MTNSSGLLTDLFRFVLVLPVIFITSTREDSSIFYSRARAHPLTMRVLEVTYPMQKTLLFVSRARMPNFVSSLQVVAYTDPP
jgi:hypothetical protein